MGSGSGTTQAVEFGAGSDHSAAVGLGLLFLLLAVAAIDALVGSIRGSRQAVASHAARVAKLEHALSAVLATLDALYAGLAMAGTGVATAWEGVRAEFTAFSQATGLLRQTFGAPGRRMESYLRVLGGVEELLRPGTAVDLARLNAARAELAGAGGTIINREVASRPRGRVLGAWLLGAMTIVLTLVCFLNAI